MIRINVMLRVNTANRDKMLQVLHELAIKSRVEMGCLGYDIFMNTMNPEKLVIIETWENAEVLDAHKQTEHFTRLVPMMQALSEEKCSEKFTDTLSV